MSIIISISLIADNMLILITVDDYGISTISLIFSISERMDIARTLDTSADLQHHNDIHAYRYFAQLHDFQHFAGTGPIAAH